MHSVKIYFKSNNCLSRSRIAKINVVVMFTSFNCNCSGIGNPRGNENPFLLAFGVLWFRWHNHLCKILSDANKDWDDERIFNEARKLVIAQHQVSVRADPPVYQ